jgi:hypothetical protein
MADNDLEHKRFELEQTVKLAELELKKKELELRKVEKKIEWNSFIPLVLGILTIGFSAFSLFHQKQGEHELEEKKLLSELILGAVEKDNYEEFAEQLDALNDLNLIRVDSARLAKFKQTRFVAEGEKFMEIDELAELIVWDTIMAPEIENNKNNPSRGPASVIEEIPTTSIFWVIVAGGDKNLEGAQWEIQRAKKAGFEVSDIWLKGKSYRTVIGKYNSYKEALENLFIVQERVNKGAYIVKNTTWCTDFEMDPTNNFIICK